MKQIMSKEEEVLKQANDLIETIKKGVEFTKHNSKLIESFLLLIYEQEDDLIDLLKHYEIVK